VVYPGKFLTRCRDASLPEREVEVEIYGPSGWRWALAGSAKRVLLVLLFPSAPVMFYGCKSSMWFERWKWGNDEPFYTTYNIKIKPTPDPVLG